MPSLPQPSPSGSPRPPKFAQGSRRRVKSSRLGSSQRLLERTWSIEIHRSRQDESKRKWRELADALARPLSIIFKRWWRSGKIPDCWCWANSYLEKMPKKVILRVVSLHELGKSLNKFSQNMFLVLLQKIKQLRTTKHKSCQTNMIASDCIHRWQESSRYHLPHLSKAFNSVFHSILAFQDRML